MDDFAYRLIARAPVILVAIAAALFVGGVLNGIVNYANYANNDSFQPNTLTYLWGIFLTIAYQPAILLAWASAIHYLSVIAGRRVP